MARPHDLAKRAELLAGVVDYIGSRGLGGLSLRPLAAELGTSSRMLIYYFGTKEDLLIQALTAHRPDVANLFADVTDAAGLRSALCDFSAANGAGSGTTSVKVLLQVLAAACVPGSPFADYARSTVDVMITALTDVLTRVGTVEDPEAVATMLISGLRGILLDRFVTGDLERTDRSSRLLIAQLIPDGPATAAVTNSSPARRRSR